MAEERTNNTSNTPSATPPVADEAYMKARRRFLAVWTWVGAILLVGVGVFMTGILAIPLGIILWTVVFVFLLGGVVDFFDRRGVPRVWATVIAYVLLIAILGLLVFFVVSPDIGLGAQFGTLAASLPSYVDSITAWGTDFYNRYADVIQSDMVQQWLTGFTSSLGDIAQTIASASASGVIAAGGAIGNVFLTMGFAIVIAFWMLTDLPRVYREAARLVGPNHRESGEMFYLTFTRVMGGYIKATLLQCGLIGLCCGILYAILGIASPAALGVITGLLNIIPIVGPWLGGALAFISWIFIEPIVAIIALAGTIVIQQTVYTFISPKLMSSSVDIHPALTFIALMGGAGIGTAMGGLAGALVGALLSIPFVAFAKAMFVYYFEKNTGRRIVSEDGVFFKGATSSAEVVDPMADATAAAPDVALPFPLPGSEAPDAAEASAAEDEADKVS